MMRSPILLRAVARRQARSSVKLYEFTGDIAMVGSLLIGWSMILFVALRHPLVNWLP